MPMVADVYIEEGRKEGREEGGILDKQQVLKKQLPGKFGIDERDEETILRQRDPDRRSNRGELASLPVSVLRRVARRDRAEVRFGDSEKCPSLRSPISDRPCFAKSPRRLVLAPFAATKK